MSGMEKKGKERSGQGRIEKEKEKKHNENVFCHGKQRMELSVRCTNKQDRQTDKRQVKYKAKCL